ncbi:RNA dependent RNA polymerase domain containing protein [Naviculisporaceae sp. PSN 640]
MSSSQPLPSTPRKRDGTVDDVILKLNADYCLGLQLPDPSITPQRRRELAAENSEYARGTKINQCIRLLSFKDNDLLHKVVHSFGLEVEAESQNWFPRFTLGRDYPTAGQRLKMQNMLLGVLERAMQEVKLPVPRGLDASTQPVSRTAQFTNPNASFPQPTPPRNSYPSNSYHRASVSPSRERSERRNFNREENGDEVDKYVTSGMRSAVRQPAFQQPAIPSQRPRTKRPSLEAEEDEDDSSPKRRKGDRERPTSAMVDVIPSRRRFGNSPTPRLLHSESTGTSNNSNLSYSAIRFDSFTDEKLDSQTTVDPDSPQQKVSQKRTTMMRDTHASPAKSTPYPPSSTVILPSKSQKRRPAGTIEDPISLDDPPEPAPVIQRQYPSSPTLTGTVYSSVPGIEDYDDLWNMQSSDVRGPEPQSLEARLQNIWPKFPRWLHNAPFGLAWELTRICLHCRVDLDDPTLRYNPVWASQTMNDIWRDLREHDLFRGKSFPERPSAEAFAAALSGSFESKGNVVVLAATLDFNPEQTGPLFLVDLKPLRLDQGCRLTRRFGADRFFEILLPNPTSQSAPKIVKDPGAADRVMEWMSDSPHSLLGRVWRGFYMKDAGYRQPAKEFRLSPEAQKPIVKERVHLFAESGHQFRPIIVRSQSSQPPPDTQRADERTEFKVSQMLDWLLELKKNDHQPYLKLFSRIQLGLSKTFPIMVFEHHQIRNHREDILSPTGKVMNDGIGRMSRSVAKKIRDVLGLADIPSAVQGRMGPAKGMWLMDVSDTGDGDWIETYPSQRKWVCDARDPHQRTLEVRSVASELKSAGLNLQFLPVLEDRAKDPDMMRRAIAARLTNDLQKQFESQKAAFKRPLQFRQWMTENFSGRGSRVKHGHVPFLGGLPESKEEVMNFLLNSGFDPKKQKYLQELAWDLQKQKCDTLRTKLNIKVGRSAYVYMVVDFWGVLEENEVHLGFSSKFRDETDDTSYTLLADCDVLVARSPAHFPSDVQKVKAVFKSELHALKDVIVFSAKGNIPLADKLSGGDYDGDLAWVCWDQDIVDSFTNAEVPEQPDLSSYLKKNKTTFRELVANTRASGRDSVDKAVYDMINKSFQFSMQPNLLGICTNFKERLCYMYNSVSNEAALVLSTLVGNLVDQSKQGIEFPTSAWEKLKKDQFPSVHSVVEPAYKRDAWVNKEDPRHIIDFLKFKIAKPAIDAELSALHKATTQSKSGNGSQGGPESWDSELVCYYESFKAIGHDSKSTKGLLDWLIEELGKVSKDWKTAMMKVRAANTDFNYQKEVNEVYEKYRAITPKQVTKNGTKVDSKMVRLLEQSFLPDPELSYWAVLKASTTFKLFYKSNPKFVWQMAGRQLAFMKAQMSSGGDGAPALLTPLMYAGLAPDQKFVKQYTARLDGEGSEYPDDEEIDLLVRDDDY